MNKAYVVGVGMTKFEKPGKGERDYPEMAREAGSRALADAGLAYSEVEQACVGYVYGDSTAGQTAVYSLGMTGIPVVNVNNNCSTGSTALFYARQLVAGGLADCVLALGFEQMQRGSLPESAYPDRVSPFDRFVARSEQISRGCGGPMALELFGGAGREHMRRYGTSEEQFAKIAVKNHRHSGNNPYAQFRDPCTLEQVLESTSYGEPLTKLQCSPTSDGSAAALIASERFVAARGLEDRAVEILAQAMVTDFASTFDGDAITLVGAEMSRAAANAVYDRTGLGPEDVDVIELHDCFSTNELLTYEALGLCGEGEGGDLVDADATTYGGEWVVNPSGGLISKGHPLGATGLAQCSELTWQLRGEAEARQVDGARIALQHNIGLGGAVVVTIYGR